MNKPKWSTSEKTFLVLFALAALGMIIFAIISLAMDAIESAKQPVPTKAPTKAPKIYTVTFKVVGTAQTAYVTGSCLSTEWRFEEVVNVPWEKTLQCKKERGKVGDSIKLDATHRANERGSLTCEIYVDGVLISFDTQSTHTESLSIAQCYPNDW